MQNNNKQVLKTEVPLSMRKILFFENQKNQEVFGLLVLLSDRTLLKTLIALFENQKPTSIGTRKQAEL